MVGVQTGDTSNCCVTVNYPLPPSTPNTLMHQSTYSSDDGEADYKTCSDLLVSGRKLEIRRG